MPEWGQLPIPKKLLAQGVRDMVRISDARMSGTSYGACVLHVAPESFVGGPLALVRDGDLIELDVAARKLELKVDATPSSRRAAPRGRSPRRSYERGYGALYQQHITQADQGCDFDFLEGHRADCGTGDSLSMRHSPAVLHPSGEDAYRRHETRSGGKARRARDRDHARRGLRRRPRQRRWRGAWSIPTWSATIRTA